MKDERRNYLAVGGFVLAMLAALILWLALLSGRVGTADLYEIHYDNVGGIAAGTQVRLQGYSVGTVEDIVLGEDGHFSVWVRIGSEWEIPVDSVAQIASSGVLSAAVIDIQRGRSPEMVPSGGQIQSIESASLFSKIESVAGEISQIANEDLAPLLESVGERAPGMLEDLETFTREIREMAQRMNALFDQGNVARVETILVNLEGVSTDVAALTRDLGETREQMDALLATVNDAVERGAPDFEAALADLHRSLDAIARHADSIAYDLEGTSRNMNEFSDQMRRDPSVLLRGRENGAEPETP